LRLPAWRAGSLSPLLTESFQASSFLDHLHWTSREDVAAKLVALAHGEDASVASRAGHLLGAIATPELALHLVALALRRDRPVGVRSIALVALARLGTPLPDAMLDALLDEQPHAPHEGEEVPNLEHVVALARTEAQRARVTAFLDRAGPDVRAHLLACGPADEIRAPLLTRWLADVDLDEPTVLDREVALNLLDRRVAVHVMLAYWRSRGVPRRPGFLADLRYYPRLVTLLPSDDLRVAAAEAFRLDLGHELELLGASGLRRALRRAVHNRSFALRCPVEPRYDEDATLYGRALQVLEEWHEGARIALGLLTSAVLHAEVRKELVRILWRARRAWGRRWIASRIRDPEAIEEVRAAADEARRAPSVEDRDVLRAMLAVSDDQVRSAAIAALDGIAELDPASLRDEGLADILAAITSRPHPKARLVAALSLVRRGHRRFLAPLREAWASWNEELSAFALAALGSLANDPDLLPVCIAELEEAAQDSSLRVRAQAVGLLAFVPNPGAHVDTFERALSADEAGDAGERLVHNAALALGVAGGERALTALLRAAFHPRMENPWLPVAAVRAALEHADDTPRERREAIWEAGQMFF
jgi:hypothetical protein